ncbi:hypothetical protein [Actinomadura montaniterrae]|uniref:Uncharacterized protein n=1 Tax=Actinomadura montaniterrae TaxID=1803903 RepID=A0A6L3VIG8_9ACTN|nr:hypothetical protein [Actinomadura montaniterrae]KAB2362889.1 hypothetical protein F9B16_44195 [Actinomadura montaniterrae]
MRMLARLLVLSALTCGAAVATSGITWASTSPSPSPATAPAGHGDSVVSAFNNTGDDAGNDSWLEIDRSLNLAKGDGSPGSDIINEVSGASSGMSPGSSNGSLSGTSTTTSPPQSDDE